MQTAQDVSRGARVIILDEVERQSGVLHEHPLIEALEEEAAIVTEHFRFD
jgi:hypothetical protein